MRTIYLVPVAAVAAALSLSAPSGPNGPPLAKEARLEHAARVIADEGRTETDVKGVLLDLLDEAIASAPASGLPGEWAQRTARARSLMAAGSPVDEEARHLLEESWRIATGKPWAMPSSVRRIEDATALVKRDVDGAARALREGRAADGVRLLLEAVLAVVTPMHAPAARS
jgi:hypothetical protein